MFASLLTFHVKNSWSDNTELNYTNWRKGEPNGCCGTDVKCALVNFNQLSNGHWDDVDCNTVRSTKFVCKKKL
ncbi:unnamed protein product [Thelazia callipaeda]|uniref:C-type lectin domain-containing protein n=1 Tax=Thelazia callipaeda TaxID=103827 RepID=A0A0N5CW59_THECL|nr:unnamed protein product [Thelazia callipaeda]